MSAPLTLATSTTTLARVDLFRRRPDGTRDPIGELYGCLDGDGNEVLMRKIAASELLYEALEALSLVVGLTAFKHEGQRAPLQDAVDAARAALAKARGEAHG